MFGLQKNNLHLIGLVSATIFIVFHLILFFNGVEDDAYISFRYLNNLVTGNGLVFNPGERVEGYTNFFWIIVLAPLHIIGINPEVAAYILCLILLACLLVTVYATTRLLATDDGSAWSAVILLASSAVLVRWVSSGMETVFVAATLAYANWHLVRYRIHSIKSSLVYGIAVLIRPDAVLFAAASFIAALLTRGYRQQQPLSQLIKMALYFTALPLAHLIFRKAYYGEWLPNTFYAKLSGQLPDLVPAGLSYLWSYLISGGWFLALPVLLIPIFFRFRNWLITAFLLQLLFLCLYVTKIGGDYFAFNRFLVPGIPVLCTPTALSLLHIVTFLKINKAVALVIAITLATGQSWFSYHSHAYQAYLETVISGQERALVAEWLLNNFSGNPLIAVNAAGLIPYKTMLPTIDMLGLNDHHIARVTNMTENTGAKFVGHFKYDGEYVCQLRPDVVILAGGSFYRGRNKREAMLQSAANTFASDRAFLNSQACQGKYKPVADELRPGQFVVVYTRQAEGLTIKKPEPGASAQTWFEHGLTLIGQARFIEAQHSFQKALSKEPLNPGILTNLAYTYFDTKQYSQAIEYFRRALSIKADYYDALFGLALAYENAGYQADALIFWEQYVKDAPDSSWKEQAQTHIRLLKGMR
jgi:hypothetical protein